MSLSFVLGPVIAGVVLLASCSDTGLQRVDSNEYRAELEFVGEHLDDVDDGLVVLEGSESEIHDYLGGLLAEPGAHEVLFEDIRASLGISDPPSRTVASAGGAYSPDDHEIILSDDWRERPGLIVHELTHAAVELPADIDPLDGEAGAWLADEGAATVMELDWIEASDPRPPAEAGSSEAEPEEGGGWKPAETMADLGYRLGQMRMRWERDSRELDHGKLLGRVQKVRSALPFFDLSMPLDFEPASVPINGSAKDGSVFATVGPFLWAEVLAGSESPDFSPLFGWQGDRVMLYEEDGEACLEAAVQFRSGAQAGMFGNELIKRYPSASIEVHDAALTLRRCGEVEEREAGTSQIGTLHWMVASSAELFNTYSPTNMDVTQCAAGILARSASPTKPPLGVSAEGAMASCSDSEDVPIAVHPG